MTPRLLSIARQVPEGARFADIGTDHARLPVWLLEHGVISSAIACDLRMGPLERAQRTAERHGLTGRFSFRLGSGLEPLCPGEADAVAIAGMGGETISEILSTAPWAQGESCTFFLQSMTSTDALRRWLSGHGWAIEREELVREGETIYVVLTVRYGTMPPLSPAEIWVGRQRQDRYDPLRSAYLDLMSGRAEKALEGLRRSGRPEESTRRDEMELLCTQLRAIKGEWDAWQR